MFWKALVASVSGLSVAAATPATPRTAPRYLYYLHGKIVEDLGPRGISPRFGAYDYPGIIAAFAKAGLTVVSEVRPKDTDGPAYADTIVAAIRAQLQAGVPPAHITVVGASKGSVIAALVSTRLNRSGVRYVLLANCNDWLIREIDPKLTGDVLSIYEASDELAGSCKPVAARSAKIGRFSELRLNTGLGHGIVYRPLTAWVKPALTWAKRP